MTGPPDVARYLHELVARLAAEADDDLAGVYVIGSLALGGYVPGRSDIDVVAVSTSALPIEAKRSMVASVSHPNLACPSRGLELVVYERAVVTTPTPGAAFSINLNSGPAMEESVSFDPATEPAHWFVLDRSIARSNGIGLFGPPSNEMFAELPRAWVIEAVVESLRWHRAHEGAGANVVLNALRSLRFAREGIWSSKVEAGRWALGGGEDRAVIDAALALRAGVTSGEPGSSAAEDLVSRIESELSEATGP